MRSTRQKDTFEYEEELQIDGEETVWETRISPVVVDDEVDQLVGATRNITERKQRERRYDAVFNNTYQFMGLLDPAGQILEVNEPALAFGGLDHDDVVGEQMWDAPWFQQSAETKEHAREMVYRASEGEFVRTELTVQGQDQELRIDFSIRPALDETGEITFLIPEGRCVEQLKKQELSTRAMRGPW